MGLLGSGAQSVTAPAVATLAPAQSFCNAAPVGICSKPGGYQLGEWITGNFTSSGNNDDVTGSFRWVDFTPNAGGNSEIRDQLAGSTAVCDIRVGNNVQQPGVQQGAKAAYNTRFGIYPNGANAYTAATAPPDHTGYGYPNQAPGAPVISIPAGNPPIGNAYADYRMRQSTNTPFTPGEYPGTGTQASRNIPGTPDPNGNDYITLGSDRRLVAAPIIDCAGGNVVPILGMAGMTLPPKVARAQIASAINVVIQVNRLTDGKRKLISISEITGLEGEMISMQDVFTFKQTGVGTDGAVKGSFQASGMRPRFMERLKSRGIVLPESLFDPSRRME